MSERGDKVCFAGGFNTLLGGFYRQCTVIRCISDVLF